MPAAASQVCTASTGCRRRHAEWQPLAPHPPAADKRADLDLQINLLAEHELTKLTEVVTAIAARLDVRLGAEIEEVKKDVAPEAVLDELDARQENN